MEVPYHYQFRVIVIGDTMVGKSSLLKTFSDGTFGEMEPTVGVDFFSKIIEIKPKQQYNNTGASTTTNNNPVHLRSNLASNNYYYHHHQHNRLQDENIVVKLQIWDTAGQERFKSIVTSYYRNSVGIILVYDVTNRESYDHLIDWFTEARRHVEPSPTTNNMSPPTHNPPSSTKNSSTNVYPLTSTPNVSPTKRQSNSNSNNNNYDNISQLSFSGSSSRNNATTPTDTSNISFNSFSERRFRLDYDDSDYKMAYLVLGCKTDLECQRQVSYEDGQAFADLYGFKFIETSSKTHYNVNQAFQLLAEEIYDKISECGRLNRLHRTASGGHLTFDGMSSQANEGIRIGPLIENTSRHYSDGNGVCLLEAQPVSGFLGGCC